METARNQELENVIILLLQMVVLIALGQTRKKNHVWEEFVPSMEIGAPGDLGLHVQRTA